MKITKRRNFVRASEVKTLITKLVVFTLFISSSYALFAGEDDQASKKCGSVPVIEIDECMKSISSASIQFTKKTASSTNEFQKLIDEVPKSPDACVNGDFENGFQDWKGFEMEHNGVSFPLESTLFASRIPFFSNSCTENSINKCTIVMASGTDPAVPLVNTTFSGNSMRLGGYLAGSRHKTAEGIARKFVVTPANAIYYFKYAIVMDKSHVGADSAFFQARAIDSTGATVDKVEEVAAATNPFISKFPKPTGYNFEQYYRNWRCAKLDLRSHIGQEVTVYFVNSDCKHTGHRAHTYIDDICVECDNSDEEGEIKLEYEACHKDGDAFDVSGTFKWPTITGITGKIIELEIYQANVLVGTITSPIISGPNFTFNLSSSDFPNLGCFDIVAVQKYSFPDMNGVLQEVTNYSSKPIAGIQQGTKRGVDNDICFNCEPPPPPPPKNCLVLEPKLECVKGEGWQVSLTNNTPRFNPADLDIKSLTSGVTVVGTSPSWSLSGVTPNSIVKLSANGVMENGGSEKGTDLCCSAEIEIKIPDEECPIIYPPEESDACMLAETSPAGPFFDKANNQWAFPLVLTSLNGNTINEVKVTPVTAGVTMTNGPVYPVGTPSLSFTGVTAGQMAEFKFCGYDKNNMEENESFDCCKVNVKIKIRETQDPPKGHQPLEVMK